MDNFYDNEKNYIGAGRSPIPGNVSFDEWIAYGMTKGWCGPPVCETHDGTPTSDAEIAEFEEGHDPCIHIVRLYEDAEAKKAIEESHSPSQWRNHYTKN